mgnify:CR=1 FL=1
MRNDPRTIWPGDRVLVFDHRLFKDDVSTPLSMTMQPATVLRRYGEKKPSYEGLGPWLYPDLIDVVFDHDGRESHAHFTSGAELLSARPSSRRGYTEQSERSRSHER